jgi:hypothetical protein
MADAMQMITGVRAYYWTPFVRCSDYDAFTLDLLPPHGPSLQMADPGFICLCDYGVLARPDWDAVLRSTFIPHVEWTKNYIAVLVGILGTTISPYLFFWQAAQEVEEDREHGKTTLAQRRGSTNEELRIARTDVITGMLLSNVVMLLSHPDNGRDPERARDEEHRDGKASCRGPTPACGQRCVLAFHPGHNRDRHARRASSGGLLRVCDCGGSKVEIGLSEFEAAVGTQVLRCDCDSHTCRTCI